MVKSRKDDHLRNYKRGSAMPDNDYIEGVLSEILQKESSNRLKKLLDGYRLSSLSEGKSPNTIAIVESSVRYLVEFLTSNNLSTDVSEIGIDELRRFGAYLRERPRFAHHRFTKPQSGRLSGHTVNGYMRALQTFWSWLGREDFIEENPFARLKIPKAPKKVIPIFTEEQLRQLFGAVDVTSPIGYRDYAIMLTLLDTGIRCNEFNRLRLPDVNFESRLFKVWG
jgi:site-specific recombinase XerD